MLFIPPLAHSLIEPIKSVTVLLGPPGLKMCSVVSRNPTL